MRSSIPPDSQDAAPMVTVIASRGSALPGSGLAAFARSRSAMTRAPWAFCVGKEGEKLLASPSPDRVQRWLRARFHDLHLSASPTPSESTRAAQRHAFTQPAGSPTDRFEQLTILTHTAMLLSTYLKHGIEHRKGARGAPVEPL